MNLFSRLLIFMGLKLTAKKNKWKWITEVAREVNKSMTEEAIKLGQDVVELERMNAMLKYIESLQERLNK